MIKKLMIGLYKKIELSSFRKKWREENKHNFTYAENIFPIDKVQIGKNTYGPLQITSYGDNNCCLQIGAYCSLSHNVRFLLGGEHNYRTLSTYPFHNNILKRGTDTENKGNIIIGDDVWIGENVLVLSGVKIGQGAVIGAGSIVAKEIPPYAVAVGNPIRVIRYRCSEERIGELLKCDYTKLTEEMIKEHETELGEDIETAEISWFPQKGKKGKKK